MKLPSLKSLKPFQGIQVTRHWSMFLVNRMLYPEWTGFAHRNSDSDCDFVTGGTKASEKIQHCQTQISNLMPRKIFPFPPSVFISPLIQIISIPVRHDIKWLNSNISPILWCKILFREWHTFWHLRFFTEIWNTKARKCCQLLKYKHLPQVQ